MPSRDVDEDMPRACRIVVESKSLEIRINDPDYEVISISRYICGTPGVELLELSRPDLSDRSNELPLLRRAALVVHRVMMTCFSPLRESTAPQSPRKGEWNLSNTRLSGMQEAFCVSLKTRDVAPAQILLMAIQSPPHSGTCRQRALSYV